MTINNWAVVLPRDPNHDHRYTFSLQMALEIDQSLIILDYEKERGKVDITIPFKDDVDNEFLVNSIRRWSNNTANFGTRDGITFGGILICEISNKPVLYMGTFEYNPKQSVDWTSFSARVRFRGSVLDIDEDSTAYDLSMAILHRRREQYEEFRNCVFGG